MVFISPAVNDPPDARANTDIGYLFVRIVSVCCINVKISGVAAVTLTGTLERIETCGGS
jgi:hypothetical protein